ncbi:hypothetical protein D1872_281900 [compost metagenome]
MKYQLVFVYDEDNFLMESLPLDDMPSPKLIKDSVDFYSANRYRLDRIVDGVLEIGEILSCE